MYDMASHNISHVCRNISPCYKVDHSSSPQVCDGQVLCWPCQPILGWVIILFRQAADKLAVCPVFLYFNCFLYFLYLKKILYLPNYCGHVEVSCNSSLQQYFCARNLHIDDHLWMDGDLIVV